MSQSLREFRPRCELFLREFHPRCDELFLRERPRCDELSWREFSISFSIIIEFFQNEKRTKPQTAR